MKSKAIGQRIKYYRGEKRLTQSQLANQIGVSCETLGKMERGVYGITLENAILISEALEVSLDNLILGKEYCIRKNISNNLTTAIDNLNKRERSIIRNILNSIIDML